MSLTLDLKGFWSLSKCGNYYASHPIYGFIWQQLQNMALTQGPLPIQIEEQS